MTKWQWRIIIALVRYVVAQSGFAFPGMDDEQLGREDRETLIEALTREANGRIH